MENKNEGGVREKTCGCCGMNFWAYTAVFFAMMTVASLAYIYLLPGGTCGDGCLPCNCTNCSGNQNCFAGKNATRSVGEIKEYVGRVMASYTDLMYSQVPEPEYDPLTGQWSAEIVMQKGPAVQVAMIRIDDANLTLNSAYLEAPKPPIISQNAVVTNGTIKLFGKMDCSQGGKPRIMEFSDPYCPTCILGDEKVALFKQAYGQEIDFEYHVLQSTSEKMKDSFGREDVDRLSKYFLCTQEQGMLDSFQQCAVLKYRTKGVEAPLTLNETDECLPMGLNRTAFDECLAVAPYEIDMDKKLAETYGVLETPVMLVDCQYRMHPTYLEHGFCFAHPEVAGCDGQ